MENEEEQVNAFLQPQHHLLQEVPVIKLNLLLPDPGDIAYYVNNYLLKSKLHSSIKRE